MFRASARNIAIWRFCFRKLTLLLPQPREGDEGHACIGMVAAKGTDSDITHTAQIGLGFCISRH